MRTRSSLSALCISLFSASVQAQTVWYVDDDGDTENGCTTWQDACPELQTALGLASDGDQIWVAIGTYKPDYNIATGQHTGDREARFQLISGVPLYGGFDGTEQSLEDRAGLFDDTILSGDLLDNDDPATFPWAPSYYENSSLLVARVEGDDSAFLNGFKVTAAMEFAGGAGAMNGGMALHCTFHRNLGDCGGMDGGTAVNCTFSENWGMIKAGGLCDGTAINCTFIGNAGWEGGGMHAGSASGCEFIDNIASEGGGMYGGVSSECLFEGNEAHWGGAMAHGDATGCIFTGNTADLFGGGIEGGTATNCTFIGNSVNDPYGIGGGGAAYSDALACLFVGNTARDGGGMLQGTATSCTFQDNIAERFGGGMASGTAIDCEFIGNLARRGGGMGTGNSAYEPPVAINCTFRENRAVGFAGSGGGMHGGTAIGCVFMRNTAEEGGGGGMWAEISSGGVAINSLFLGNKARTGGGMASLGALAVAVNCLFIGNRATATDGGGAWWTDTYNCTFSGNSAEGEGGALGIFSSAVNSILWANTPDQAGGYKITVLYSDVEGGWAGEGNIEADPLFVRAPDPGPDGEWGTADDDYGDLRLLPGSPAIDAGNSGAMPQDVWDLDGDGDTDEPIPVDLDGRPRFLDDPDTPDTGNPDGTNPIVDMGAYEFLDPCPDDDGDGRVTICHIPPGNLSNARTITVNVEALPAHLAHGDYCGPCEGGRG